MTKPPAPTLPAGSFFDDWRAVLIIIIGLGLWHGPVLVLAPGVNHDEVALNAAARNWSEGEAASLSLLADAHPTYARAFYWQPPGQLWLMAAAYRTLGFSIGVTRGVSLVSAMLLGALAYLALRRLGLARALAGGVTALLLLHPQMIWLARSGRPDGFALSAGLLSFHLLSARPSPRARDWAGAGLLLGVGGLFHIMILSWAPALWLATCRRMGRIELRAGVMVAAGATVPLLGWILVTFARGHGADWIEQFWRYSVIQRSSGDAWWTGPFHELALFVGHFRYQPLSALAIVVGVAAAVWAARRSTDRALQLGLGSAFTLLAVATAKGTGMYPLYWFTWAALVAGTGFSLLPRRVTAVILGVGLANGLVWHGLMHGIAWHQREARDPARVAAFFASNLPSGAVVVGPEDIWYAVESAGAELRIWVEPERSSHRFLVTYANEHQPVPEGFHLVAELPDEMPKVFGRYFSHTACAYRLWRRDPPMEVPASP